MDGVQRRGSAARMNYIKRFVAVLLCLVVCAGLLPPPRARAAGAGAIIAAGGGVAAAPVLSVLCTLAVTVAGVDFVQGYLQAGEKGVFGTGAYEVGSKFREAMEPVGGAVWEWIESTAAVIEGKGGFTAGQEITIPSYVTEAARQWVNQAYDFSSGAITVNQGGFYTEAGSYVLFSTVPSAPPKQWVPYTDLGTVVGCPEQDAYAGRPYNEIVLVNSDQQEIFRTVRLSGRIGWLTSLSPPQISMGPLISDGGCGLAYSEADNAVFWGFLNLKDHTFNRLSTVSTLSSMLINQMSKTGVLDIPSEEDLTVAVPGPLGKVGDMTIPIGQELTREGILEDSGEVVEPTTPPIVTSAPGEMVGDIAIADIATAAQDSKLRELLITKFPFSIPWDLYNAIKLLAAPPQTPHWEVDFMAPIAHRVGGFKGSTKIVLDFSDYEILGQLCRWVTTIMFISSLAMGTKKLMWTA